METETLVIATISAGVIVVVAALLIKVKLRGERRISDGSSWDDREAVLQAGIAELNFKLASVQESVTRRDAALGQQMEGIGDQMRRISGLFNNDRSRGAWGEISMLRIFELGGLLEGRDFTSQFNAGDRHPDAVVHLPGGRDIVIDSKFPIARYSEALDADDPSEASALLAEQGKELERVGKNLVDKGYGRLASGAYVVMYLPSQAVYEASAEAHPEVIERLMRKRVIVVGPTTLFALLLHAGSLITEHRAIQQSDEILDAARQLNGRMTTFLAHLQRVGASLSRAVESFNGAVGSWSSRVAPQLERMNDLGGHDPAERLDPVDEAVRHIELDAPSEVTGSLN